MMTAVMTDQIVEVDSRRRISLGRLGRAEHTRYLAQVEDDGTIVLTPAVVVSALEARVLSDPKLMAQIIAGLTDDSEVEVDRSSRPA